LSKKTINQVASGIYQILGHNRAAHAYVIKGRRRNVMIDSGLPNTFQITEACLSEIGLATTDIDLMLLTHEHIDHAGGAALMPSHCLMAAHRLAANKLALKDEFALMNHAFSINTDHFEVDICLEQGSVIDLGSHELEVIHTPGHCSGSICVYEHHNKVLFSADTIMANGIVGGVLGSGNISDYVNSLRRLRSWRADLLLPGHGQNSINVVENIDIGIDRLETLLHESREVFNSLKNSGHGFDHVMRSLRELNVK
jgi:glyoxylase-like metal-dependent hydrolase (beta-lactamase superfamily II)